jgi:hypothetical protein
VEKGYNPFGIERGDNRSMATDRTPDSITSAVLSGTAYERLRQLRASHFNQPLPRKLTMQGGLLASLATIFPMFLLYPETAAEYIGSTDPAVAAPKVTAMGVFGGSVVFLSAALLVIVALYRLRHAPLTEQQAHAVLTAEDFASYMGVGTGGMAILVTLALFALGLGGGETLGSYVATMDGHNPLGASQYGVSVLTLTVAALAGSAVIFITRAYLQRRLADL